jgi:cytochrome c553
MARRGTTTWKRAAFAAALALGGIAPAGAARAEDAARGKHLFQLCQQCHGADGGGNALALAPSIAGLERWYVERQLFKFRDGVRGTHFDDIAGMRMRPMARMLRHDEDLKAVAAYVASLPPVKPLPTIEGGDAARGQTFYATCTACHGPEGKGNETLQAPALNHANDWYLVRQLQNYKQGVRGTNPKDQQGPLMRPMAMTLPDEQALKDVAAYIGTLSK